MGQRPSRLARILGTWEALQFDQAVTTFGIVIENAAQERINTGSEDKPQWRNKYTLGELLTSGFVLERDDDADPLQLRGADGVQYDEAR